uniref:Protein kinase domain containing, cytoplasmic n=1 Tax=Poecilia reticulata TaxID=8081 RepID=A0A3P9PQZ6_POERE
MRSSLLQSSLTRGCKVTSALRVGHTSRGSFLGAEQEPPAAAAESSDSERSLCRSAVPAAPDGKAPGMGHSLRAAALLAFVVLSVLVSLLITSLKQFGSGSTRFFNATNPEELRRGLDDQLRERRKEILPLLLPLADGDEKNGVLGEAQHSSDSALDLSLWNEVTLGTGKAHRDQMGCESLVDVRAVEVLGSGYTKLVVKANVAGGQAVALKMVNEQGVDMRKCLKEFKDAQGCRELVSYKLRKEMLLLQRLRHPNVIKICYIVSIHRGRVAVILEQGAPLQMIQLLQTPWEDRFRVCLDLVRLLHFLSRSPLGSVGLLDFQPRQFVTVSGQLKLTDLDDVSAGELACRTHADCTLKFPHRNFTVLCSTRGVCDGLNEKRNIYNAYRFFFTYLLPHQAPPGLTHLVDHIMNTTGELKADINQTLQAFEHILLLYKSGLHLDNLHPSALRGESCGKEYRCWPSYSQQGCVLSVHSAREAAHICNSHSQCSSFTLTGQKTWTGEKLL